MARCLRLTDSSTWLALCAMLGLSAVLCFNQRTEDLDWQPALVGLQPWRAWTAAFVHLSALHLVANIAGLVFVALLGCVVGCDARAALAWFVAWPLSHWGLALQPTLLHYGGLSGILHAGVAVVALQAIGRNDKRSRLAGRLLVGALAWKLLVDKPWTGTTRNVAGWDIAIAPFAHVTGCVAGAACAGLLQLMRRVSKADRSD